MTKELNPIVVLEDAAEGYSQAITCPNCGYSYMHSGRVIVYHRREDEKQTLTTVVNGGQTRVSLVGSHETRNPSSRRHGIAIAFECEGCDATPELTLEQHKGVTYTRWRNANGGVS